MSSCLVNTVDLLQHLLDLKKALRNKYLKDLEAEYNKYRGKTIRTGFLWLTETKLESNKEIEKYFSEEIYEFRLWNNPEYFKKWDIIERLISLCQTSDYDTVEIDANDAGHINYLGKFSAK